MRKKRRHVCVRGLREKYEGRRDARLCRTKGRAFLDGLVSEYALFTIYDNVERAWEIKSVEENEFGDERSEEWRGGRGGGGKGKRGAFFVVLAFFLPRASISL